MSAAPQSPPRDARAEIVVTGLSKRYGRREALREVTFSVDSGGFLAVFGANGAGKTTILRVLAGLTSASSGCALVAGADVREDPMAVRRAVGLISHASLLYPDLSAYENLRFYADMYGLPAARREARIEELLERVELGLRRHDRVRSFSRGMCQRLAIARALLHRPRVLLLDEPSSGLDVRAAGILGELLAEIRAEHTFVMATHAVQDGLRVATQALVLDAGRIAYCAAGESMSAGEVAAALGVGPG